MNNSHNSIDKNTLEGLKMIMGSSFGLIVEKYIQTSAETLQQIENAIKNDEYELIYMAAHSLKSASAQLGAMLTSEYCTNIEAMATENNKKEIINLFTNLKSEHQTVCNELQKYVA